MAIPAHFPGLQYLEDETGQVSIEGSLQLYSHEGDLLDTYRIRIVESDHYPYAFPYVYETGGRLPINIDWHVFQDGHCCIISPPEESLLCKDGIDLSWFIRKQLIPYFFNQKFRETHGYYLNERSHGTMGILEYFYDLFGCHDHHRIARVLYHLLRYPQPERTASCFCGSGLKFRKCCRSPYQVLCRFGLAEKEFYLQLILKGT